jgi:hypothetical protein
MLLGDSILSIEPVRMHMPLCVSLIKGTANAWLLSFLQQTSFHVLWDLMVFKLSLCVVA